MKKIVVTKNITLHKETREEIVDKLFFSEVYFYYSDGGKLRTNGTIEIDCKNNYLKVGDYVYKVDITDNDNILRYIDKYVKKLLIMVYGEESEPFITQLSLLCSLDQKEED